MSLWDTYHFTSLFLILRRLALKKYCVGSVLLSFYNTVGPSMDTFLKRIKVDAAELEA